tara:strand:- start:1037 stop:1213 length:177 start_codon:yes stop_codon:yes gene_type:complete
MVEKNYNFFKDVNKEQLDRIEKKIDKLDEKLDKHIKEIWTVYVPIKRLLEKLDKFRLW